jgi:hypothetical protein
MQPRTLDQIIGEINNTYQPQVDSLRKQQSMVPDELKSNEAALDAKKDQGFSDILSAARRRGTGVAFGGIPLAEQSKYLATDYMPALANMRGAATQKATSLEDAINQIYERRNTMGQQIYQGEQSLAENRRQFDTNLAFQREQEARQRAAAGSALPSFNQQPVQAPQYLGNNDLRGHLTYLAQKEGNQNAALALKYVGNDGRYYLDPYTTNPSIFKALDALGAVNTWKR